MAGERDTRTSTDARRGDPGAFGSVSIALPIPSPLIGGNNRGHWGKVHRARKKARWAAAVLLQVALQGERPQWDGPVSVRVDWTDRPSNWLDTDNAISRMKPTFDATQDAGLLLDDRQIGDIEIAWQELAPGDAPGIVVTFRHETGAA